MTPRPERDASLVGFPDAYVSTSDAQLLDGDVFDQGGPDDGPDADRTDADLTDADLTDADLTADARVITDAGPVLPDFGPESPACTASDLDGDGFGTHSSCQRLDCDDRNAAVFPGAAEACDGRDDDCDARIDEGLFTARCGEGACAREVPNCLDGRPNRCEPGEPSPEQCNGEDDDCDGLVDEEADGPPCGVGVCTREAFCDGERGRVCTPGAPSPEQCNGEDDDCDGLTDEGLSGAEVRQLSYERDLQPEHDGCSGVGLAGRVSPDCNAAINRFCSAVDCRDTGFGPVENSGDISVVTCLSVARVLELSFETLSAQHPGCRAGAPVQSPDCNAAIHRWCSRNGYVSGFGPLEVGPDAARVACVSDGAQVFEGRYSTLRTMHPICDGATQRMGPECNAAIHRWCADQGFASGFGPIENNGDLAFLTCVAR